MIALQAHLNLAALATALLLALEPGVAAASDKDAASGIGIDRAPDYAVGEAIPGELIIHSGFPGLDLAAPEPGQAYVRSDEHIYLIRRNDRVVIKVISIATVLLH